MKILYIHGLSSSGASGTPANLRRLLPNDIVISPDLPIDPIKALNMLHDICSVQNIDIVVGTSMGGMFAQQIHGYRKIIINPSFHVSQSMRKIMGINQWFNPRQDGETTFTITPELCDAYEAMEQHQFEGITLFDRNNTVGLFGNNDTIVNCREEFLNHYTQMHIFEGEHRLTFENIRDTIVPLINKMTKTTD